MAALINPVRVDIALETLREVLIDALSDLISDSKSIVLGSNVGGIPRRDRPYLHIGVLTLPAMVGAFTDERLTRLAYDSKTITIVSAVVGDDYKVRLNGLPARHIAAGGESITDIRDALKVKIDALGEPVTTADNGADAIDVTPNMVGAIHSLSSPSAVAKMTVSEVLGADVVTYKFGQRRMTVRLQSSSKDGKVGSGDAHAIINTALAAIDTDDALLKFKDHRLAVRAISDPLNISGVSLGGAREEQRAVLDISIHLASLTVRPANAIETVEFNLTLGTNTVTFSQDVSNP